MGDMIDHPRFKGRREWAFLEFLEVGIGVVFARTINADDLAGEIVWAATLVSHGDDRPCRGIQVVGVFFDQAEDVAIADVFVNPVGGEDEDVAR